MRVTVRLPSTLACLDPGVSHPAVAVFRDGLLAFVVVSKRREGASITPKMIGTRLRTVVDRALGATDAQSGPLFVVVEWPSNYRSKLAARRDVDALKEVAKGFAGDIVPTKYSPNAWKGNVPKIVHHARVLARLEADTFTDALWRGISEDGGLVVWWGGVGPDARDAIALGLFHLGITGRGGVPKSTRGP